MAKVQSLSSVECLNKVKRHPLYAERELEYQQMIAEECINPIKIKEKFADLLDIEEMKAAIVDGDESDIAHSLEASMRRKQQKHETARACHLPVYLFLSKLNRPTPGIIYHLTSKLRFAYGPLHAGLVVGDIGIEWDDSSLILPMPAPTIAGEFQAQVGDGGAMVQTAGKLVKDMSMANRQNMDTPKKLKILYESRDEKEKLLDDLAHVIANYNRCKKYSVFSCNCQHFVKDALLALGIEQFPEFKGDLDNYLQGLKSGTSGPSEFNSHEELDAHVRANMKKLDKHDKEYLLCLYFQFHSTEFKNLSPEQQEEWRCLIMTCQCDELEYQIREDSLYFNQFRTTSPPQAEAVTGTHISVAPNIQSIPEETEGDQDRVEEGENELTDSLISEANLGAVVSIEDQRTHLTKYSKSGYRFKVINKLKRHPDHRDKSEAELTEMGEILSEKERFREKYFSKYIDGTSIEVVSAASKDKSEAKCLSPDELQTRSSKRFETLININMKLVVHTPVQKHSRGRRSKMPVLSALLVGDHIFKLDEETNLVIPVELSQVVSKPVLMSPVLHESTWCSMVEQEKDSVTQSIRNEDHKMEIDLHFDFTRKKDEFLSAFIDTVIKFNRRASSNNQTFLAEAMKSLGIEKPIKLSNSIQQYISRLKASKSLSHRNIKTHQELDAVVAEVVPDILPKQSASPKIEDTLLQKQDVEYLNAKYFLFHASSWESEPEGERSYNKWRCSVDECKQQYLEEYLEKITCISLT